jgi:hypothetical protein
VARPLISAAIHGSKTIPARIDFRTSRISASRAHMTALHGEECFSRKGGKESLKA